MTIVEATRDEDVLFLAANGHATGSEQVCAAVSAAMFGLLGYIQNTGVGTSIADLAPGRAVLAFDRTERSEAAWELAVITLAQVAMRYPRYIRVEIKKDIKAGACGD